MSDNKCERCISRYSHLRCSTCIAFSNFEGMAGSKDTPILNQITGELETYLKPVQVVGIKHDNNKPPLSRVPRVLLEEVARVLEFGAKKYAWDNWRNGISYNRVLSAAMRHLTAYADCETMDAESGLSHLAHAACCITFLLEYDKYPEKYQDFDDRFSYLKPEDQPLPLG